MKRSPGGVDDKDDSAVFVVVCASPLRRLVLKPFANPIKKIPFSTSYLAFLISHRKHFSFNAVLSSAVSYSVSTISPSHTYRHATYPNLSNHHHKSNPSSQKLLSQRKKAERKALLISLSPLTPPILTLLPLSRTTSASTLFPPHNPRSNARRRLPFLPSRRRRRPPHLPGRRELVPEVPLFGVGTLSGRLFGIRGRRRTGGGTFDEPAEGVGCCFCAGLEVLV